MLFGVQYTHFPAEQVCRHRRTRGVMRAVKRHERIAGPCLPLPNNIIGGPIEWAGSSMRQGHIVQLASGVHGHKCRSGEEGSLSSKRSHRDVMCSLGLSQNCPKAHSTCWYAQLATERLVLLLHGCNRLATHPNRHNSASGNKNARGGAYDSEPLGTNAVSTPGDAT